MKKLLLAIVIVIFAVVAYFHFRGGKQGLINPLAQLTPRPLLVYTFDNLKKTKFKATQITLGPIINQTATTTEQTFFFKTYPKPGSDEAKTVSGVINLPKAPGTYPLIVMFRGFVPQETYQPGIGTEPAAAVFAQNGFITIAPDFLGYGQSSKGATDSFEDRFQTYTTALSLLASVKTINTGLDASYSGSIRADLGKIGIWGHSNGGHISLATLAISGVTYPTVLWAPVSKSFPYSIIYYTDEDNDQGKSLRKALADFETLYNTDLFSPPNYYKWIKAPIEVNQGTNDHEVPVWWSDELVQTLQKDGDQVTYYTYPGADHNLLPDGWSTAVENSMTFYKDQFAGK